MTEAIDTHTASGRLLFHIMGALAEFERAHISERTRAGMPAARARGVRVGRSMKLSTEQLARAAEVLQARQESLQAVSLRYGVSVSPLTRRLSRGRTIDV